jgi:hypothetical protein
MPGGTSSKERKAIRAKAQEPTQQQKDEEVRQRFAGLTPEAITSVAGAGPSELQETLAQRKDMLQGFSAPQLAAMQAQMAGGQQAGQQQRERALQAALAKQGIRGGAAASLQSQAAQQAYREKAAMDTDMLMKQAAKQEQALGAYEQGVMGAYQMAQERQFQEMAAKLAAEQQIAALEASRLQAEATTQYGKDVKAASKDGKIICTELHRQGLMPTEIYEADQAFGRQLVESDPEVLVGYYAWAEGAVELMKRSKFWTAVAYVIATPWAKQMAFEMGVLPKPNLTGWVIMSVGMPICRMIGRLKSKKAVQNGC